MYKSYTLTSACSVFTFTKILGHFKTSILASTVCNHINRDKRPKPMATPDKPAMMPLINTLPCRKKTAKKHMEHLDWYPPGINISHFGKRRIIFKMPFLGDMLVTWRVISHNYKDLFSGWLRENTGYISSGGGIAGVSPFNSHWKSEIDFFSNAYFPVIVVWREGSLILSYSTEWLFTWRINSVITWRCSSFRLLGALASHKMKIKHLWNTRLHACKNQLRTPFHVISYGVPPKFCAKQLKGPRTIDQSVCFSVLNNLIITVAAHQFHRGT